MPKIRGANLTPCKRKTDKQRSLRKLHKQLKKNIESTWQQDNHDTEVFFGTSVDIIIMKNNEKSVYGKEKCSS